VPEEASLLGHQPAEISILFPGLVSNTNVHTTNYPALFFDLERIEARAVPKFEQEVIRGPREVGCGDGFEKKCCIVGDTVVAS
jgi:hypothetical protein